MSVLINTKIDKKLYESMAITDSYPYTRPLFSDGLNSLIHFALGYVTTTFQPLIFPAFLTYKAMNYQPYDNTTTDLEEYALGMVAGGVIGENNAKNAQVPTYFKLMELGLIK